MTTATFTITGSRSTRTTTFGFGQDRKFDREEVAAEVLRLTSTRANVIKIWQSGRAEPVSVIVRCPDGAFRVGMGRSVTGLERLA